MVDNLSAGYIFLKSGHVHISKQAQDELAKRRAR
jgi:hypothetical protein